MNDLPVPPPPPPPPDAIPAGLVKYPANFGLRFVAHIIDGFIFLVIFWGSLIIVSLLFSGLAFWVAMALHFWYWAEFEGARGQTLGKKAMNIRTVRKGTLEPIGPWPAVARLLGKFISALPLGLGYLWMLWDDDQQTWHDKMVDSDVVMA